MAAFTISPVLVWFLVGLAFLLLEIMVPGFVLLFFGIGALCTAFVVYCYPFTVASQLLLFVGVSLVSLLLLRSFVKKAFQGRQSETDILDMHRDGQETGVVVEEIVPPQLGKVKFAGTFWQAGATEPLAKGAVVQVVKKENLLLKVAAITSEGGQDE